MPTCLISQLSRENPWCTRGTNFKNFNYLRSDFRWICRLWNRWKSWRNLWKIWINKTFRSPLLWILRREKQLRGYSRKKYRLFLLNRFPSQTFRTSSSKSSMVRHTSRTSKWILRQLHTSGLFSANQRSRTWKLSAGSSKKIRLRTDSWKKWLWRFGNWNCFFTPQQKKPSTNQFWYGK